MAVLRAGPDSLDTSLDLQDRDRRHDCVSRVNSIRCHLAVAAAACSLVQIRPQGRKNICGYVFEGDAQRVLTP